MNERRSGLPMDDRSDIAQEVAGLRKRVAGPCKNRSHRITIEQAEEAA